MQTSVALPSSDFIPANRRPPINNDSAQGMGSTYPAALRAAQFGANNLVSSQLAPHGIFLVQSCHAKHIIAVFGMIFICVQLMTFLTRVVLRLLIKQLNLVQF